MKPNKDVRINFMARSFVVFILLLQTVFLTAQTTKVSGMITDATTLEALPFVAISFPELGTGVTTDFDGKYSFETSKKITTMKVTFLGYVVKEIAIKTGAEQVIDVTLEQEGQQLQEVVVKAKRKRYRNKDNPAVTLIRKVRAAKKENKVIARSEHVEYGQYEKLRLDLTKVDSAFQQKAMFKGFDFLFDNLDSTNISGEPSLTFFIRETNSTFYEQKSPVSSKEVQHGIRVSGLTDLLDEDGIDFFLDKMYQNIDIYDESINIVDKRFTGPISTFGPQVYRYYILDTVLYNTTTCYRMQVWPRNKQSYAFQGELLIDTSSYAITKADLTILDDINLNFVDGLKFVQIFTPHKKGGFVPISKELVMEFKATGKSKRGILGSRKESFKNFKFGKKPPRNVVASTENVIKDEEAKIRTDEYWAQVRHEKLNKYEEAVYVKMDSLQKTPRFKRLMGLVETAATGLIKAGPVSIGPIYSMYSFNSVEGSRLRLGVQTNEDFSKKAQLSLYGLYGLKDKAFKYGASARFSLTKELNAFPKHEISINYKHATNYPGLNLQFVDDDNFFLSFKRGNDGQMLLLDAFTVNYLKEFRSNFSFGLQAKHEVQKGYGLLKYTYTDDNGVEKALSHIGIAEAGLMVRYAPGQSLYQGRKRRRNIKNNRPIFTTYYNAGFSGVGKGDYDYHRVRLNIFKRFYLGMFGYGDMIAEGGKIWGDKLPYTLLSLPEANQSFFYNPLSYNMMNFLEFSNQQYASLFYTHFFEGIILNQIPLIKKLKWRSLVSMKMLYGTIDDELNPNKNAQLVQFPTDKNGQPLTSTLNKEPYLEVSVGVYNIFKILRFDLVKRVTYLEQPNVPSLWGVKGLGMRMRFKVTF